MKHSINEIRTFFNNSDEAEILLENEAKRRMEAEEDSLETHQIDFAVSSMIDHTQVHGSLENYRFPKTFPNLAPPKPVKQILKKEVSYKFEIIKCANGYMLHHSKDNQTTTHIFKNIKELTSILNKLFFRKDDKSCKTIVKKKNLKKELETSKILAKKPLKS